MVRIKGKLGFTLLEFLLVGVIFAWSGWIVARQWAALNDYLRSREYTQQLVAALRLARMSAIARGEVVTLCASVDGQRCGGEWRWGAMVITYSLRQLKVLDPVPHQDRLVFYGNFGNNTEIKFLPNGLTDGQNGSFYYCPRGRAQRALAVIVSLAGRVRIDSKGAAAAKIDCGV